MFTLLVIVAVFVSVTALVAGVAMLVRGESASRVEDRLQLLTAGGGRGVVREADKPNLLAQPLDEMPNVLEQFFARFGNLRLFLQQADSPMTPSKFLAISAAVGFGSALLYAVTPLPKVFAPLVGGCLGIIPFLFMFPRSRGNCPKPWSCYRGRSAPVTAWARGSTSSRKKCRSRSAKSFRPRTKSRTSASRSKKRWKE
jgi:hypothetical protein